MLSKSIVRAVSVIISLSVFLAGCAPTKLPQGAGAVWHLVIISDSSLWGVGEAFAAQIEKDMGVSVVVQDYANQAGSAGEMLQALKTGKSFNAKLEELPAVLKDAEVVVMFLNPDDSINPENPLNLEGCFIYRAPTSCEPDSYEQWTADLKAIWGEILRLRKGKDTILRAVDVYNPLVSHWNENDVFEPCTKCWENMSAAARLAAEAYNIPFLSRLDAFNGPNHAEDPRLKGYIDPDGEHLSDLGAQYTAELLAQLGYEPVEAP